MKPHLQPFLVIQMLGQDHFLLHFKAGDTYFAPFVEHAS